MSEELSFGVRGMTCGACVGRVERALGKLPGVQEASVNLALERARVRYVPGSVDITSIRAAIEAAGYTVRDPDRPADRETSGDADDQQLRRDFVLAAVLAAPLLLVSMGPMLWPALGEWKHGLAPTWLWSWLELVLASAVVFGPGRRFLHQGVAELRHRSPGMNTLVMTGSLSAWVYSTLVVLVPGVFPEGTAHLYFEAAAVIVALILLGACPSMGAAGRGPMPINESRAPSRRRPTCGRRSSAAGSCRPREAAGSGKRTTGLRRARSGAGSGAQALTAASLSRLWTVHSTLHS